MSKAFEKLMLELAREKHKPAKKQRERGNVWLIPPDDDQLWREIFEIGEALAKENPIHFYKK